MNDTVNLWINNIFSALQGGVKAAQFIIDMSSAEFIQFSEHEHLKLKS